MKDTAPTGRLRALQELGAWPIRRDRLTAERVALMGAAWHAGNRNVAELARTADVSRDVVYADLRAIGVDPTDKKQPAVPTAALKAQTARARLHAQMERLFAADHGLGVLCEYNGRPDMSEQEKRIQDAWATALIAVHGIARSADVYSQYANRRQREVVKTAPLVGTWDNLVLEGKPLLAWNRDIHGFLCVNCGESFPSVLIGGLDPMCRICAREASTPDQAVPLWKAYSHSRFIFPGLLREEIEGWGGHGETSLTVRYSDGEERTCTSGDAGFLFPETSGLPYLIQKSAQVDGESRDTVGCVIDAHTEYGNRGFDVLARFTYDPRPEGSEPHPYGFRFEAARLTATHTIPARATEYTDLYETLDALITGLYSQSEPQ